MKTTVVVLLIILSFSCSNEKEKKQTFHFSGWQEQFVMLGNSYNAENTCHQVEIDMEEGLVFDLIVLSDKNDTLFTSAFDKQKAKNFNWPIQVPNHCGYVKFLYQPRSISTIEGITTGVTLELLQTGSCGD